MQNAVEPVFESGSVKWRNKKTHPLEVDVGTTHCDRDKQKEEWKKEEMKKI